MERVRAHVRVVICGEVCGGEIMLRLSYFLVLSVFCARAASLDRSASMLSSAAGREARLALSDHLASLFLRFGSELPNVRAEVRATTSGMWRRELDDLEAELLYLMVRDAKPLVVYEMSPASGYSSQWIVRALRANGAGHCHAFDISEDSRFAVSSEFNWTLHVGELASRTWWPARLEEVGLFLIDSEHSGAFAKWYTLHLLKPAHEAASRRRERVPVLNHDFYYHDTQLRPLPFDDETVVLNAFLDGTNLSHI